MGVPVEALARRETPSQDLRLFVRGPEPRHGVARSLLVEGSVDGSPFLWGKVLMSWFLFSDAFAFS